MRRAALALALALAAAPAFAQAPPRQITVIGSAEAQAVPDLATITELQTELDANVFQEPNETVREAIDKVLPKLNEILAGQ